MSTWLAQVTFTRSPPDDPRTLVARERPAGLTEVHAVIEVAAANASDAGFVAVAALLGAGSGLDLPEQFAVTALEVAASG